MDSDIEQMEIVAAVDILKLAGESADHALREHTTLLALSKMNRYEAECARFEEKYAEPFYAFKERVRSMLNEEDFQMDEDLMDWEFAYTALLCWKMRGEPHME